VNLGEDLAKARRKAGLIVSHVSKLTCIRETIITRIRETIIWAIQDEDNFACGEDTPRASDTRPGGRTGTDPPAD